MGTPRLSLTSLSGRPTTSGLTPQMLKAGWRIHRDSAPSELQLGTVLSTSHCVLIGGPGVQLTKGQRSTTLAP